jgi:dTDP-4-dehydrorhamnose reductase
VKAAVIGSRGQLGAAVVADFSNAHQVFAFDRTALDITDYEQVQRTLAEISPDVIVNCTGFNAVDASEDRPVEAFRINGIALRSLARVARSTGASLVHYSSDFVFDGEASTPYTELDRPNPRSAYAASKLVGEWLAADAPSAYVLRVESLFGHAVNGPVPKGSVAMIVERLKSGNPLKVFGDRTISPTFVMDAAAATRRLVEMRAPPGLYHCVNSGMCTWAALATEVARLLGVQPRFEVVAVADVKLRAARPKYCALSNEKLTRAGIVMPTWMDAIERYLRT